MKTKTKLPQFKGKPLIEIPSFVPQAGFLEGDFGKAVLEEYEGRAKADYSDASALRVLSYDSGVVTGSNPFAVVLVNQIVSPEGLRTSTQADLEKVLKANALVLTGQYEDTGLVLRSEENPNEYLARNLMAQIRARNPKAKMPAMIPLSELELVVDKSSPHKLGFKIRENAQVFYDLSVLNKDGNFLSEDIDEKTGLPKRTGDKGNRRLYTRESGLLRLCLYGLLDAPSDGELLANSDGVGRVVVVSAEGTAKNLEQYKAKLAQETADRESQLTGRYNTARQILADAHKQAEACLIGK